MGFAKPFGMAVACQKRFKDIFSWLYFLITVLNLKVKRQQVNRKAHKGG